jgi:hypothetical protein
MLRRMENMPAGTIGFEAVGEVEDDDWEEAVEPVLRQEIAEGRDGRLLYLIGTGAREVENEARHVLRARGGGERRGLDTRCAACAFLSPSGKARGFRVRDLAAAKAWLAEAGS